MSKLFRQTAMAVALIVAAIYLVYRGLFTLNLESNYAVGVSIALYAAEIYGVFLMSLFFYQIWDTSEPEERPALEGRTVDVLVPTYNEPIDLLRATLLAARDMEYGHRTYVLDDGRRPEVKALAEELGIGYFERDNNLHAKAGNLNHALEKTDGEFVIIFDADHIAKPHFINRTLGYFEEKDLGFVQTPHAFYNFDSFPARVNFKKRTYWEEGQLFYNVIQAGKNHWNAVVFCGSAAMFRRSALESVGLIATETITEDMHTGMRMHAKGWKSYFVNERLIAGQAAPDSTTSQSQRLRWGEGNLSIIAHDNPLTMKGLTLPQRLNYLGSMISWTAGCARAVIYMTPILMLFTGVSPVTNFGWLLGGLIVAYLGTSWSAIKIAGNGYGNLWRTEVASMADFFTQCRCTVRALVLRKWSRFVVTSKRGRQSNKWIFSIAPQVTIATLGLLALGWASYRYATGVSQDWLGLTIGGVLVLMQGLLALAVIRHALRPSPGVTTQHPTSGIHVRYTHALDDDRVNTGQAISTDISEGGVGMIAYEKLPEQHPVTLAIDAAGRHIDFGGRLRSRERVVDQSSGRDGNLTAYRYDVSLAKDGLSEKQAGEIENQLLELGMNYSVQRWYQRFGLERVPTIMEEHLLNDTLATHCPRIRLPLEIALGDEKPTSQTAWQGAVTEQLSDLEFKFLLAEPTDIGQTVHFRMDSPAGPIVGEGRVLSINERPLGRETLYLHHVELLHFEGQGRGHLQALMASRDSRRLRNAIQPTPKTVGRPIVGPLMTIATPTIAASLGLVFLFNALYQDDLLINRVARNGEPASEAEAEAVRTVYQRALDEGIEDPARLEKLHLAMNAIGESESGVTVVEQMLNQAPDNRELRFAHAVNLEEQNRADEAFVELASLVEELPPNATPPPGFETELVLQTARNAANREDLGVAIEYFGRLEPAGSDDPALREEYAGLLVTQGEVEEALAILQGTEARSTEGDLLLASVYSSESRFDQAADVLNGLLEKDPENRVVAEQLADVLSWQGLADEAAAAYERLLADEPANSQLRVKAARAHLWARNYPASLAHYALVHDRVLAEDDLKIEFLYAMAGAPTVTADDRMVMGRLYAEYRQTPPALRADDSTQAFINAFGRHNRSYELVALLEGELTRPASTLANREELADLLHSLGEFERADYHYRALLNETTATVIEPGENAPTAGRVDAYPTTSPRRS